MLRRRFLTSTLATMLAPSLARAQDRRPLRIGWVFAMANAPVLVAQAKGFFDGEGLQVDTKSFGDGPVIQQAVAAGEIDFAYIGAPPVYQWFARGLDARILAKVNSGQAAVVAKADGPVRNLADLKGRRLAGVGRGSGMDVLLRGFVLQDTAKLRPDSDVSISQLQVGNMNQALETGVVDAAFEWEPFVSQSVLRGTGRVVFDVNKALPNYPWYVIAATTKVVQDRPGDVAKLLRAHHKAVAYLNQQPTEANLIVADAFKLEPIQRPGSDPMPANAVVAEARKRLGWSDTITPSDRAFVQRLMDYSHELGFLPTSLKADQVIDTGPWESAVAATP